MQRRARPQLERLESRDAPATLVSATKLTYQDVDGDDVTVTFSNAVLNAGNVNSIFAFDTGNIGGSNAIKQQLRFIDLSDVPTAGVNITTSATASKLNGGDGFAALGQLVALNSLGTVSLDGDLGRVIAFAGVRGLTVQSLGRYGTTTGSPALNSSIAGNLGSLTVKSDVVRAGVRADTIGDVTIGGSLIGGQSNDTGAVLAVGNIGRVTIKGDVVGGPAVSGRVASTDGNIASVTIGGSIRGGGGASAEIAAGGALGQVTVKGDVLGFSPGSGVISGTKSIAGVTIGGSLRAVREFSGRIVSEGGSIGPVTIAGSLIGGLEESGQITAKTTLGNVTVGGSVHGGTESASGHIKTESGDMGFVTIKGDLTADGATTAAAGSISSGGKIAGVTIGGSVHGGDGTFCGSVRAERSIGPVKIGGDLIGNGGQLNGYIYSSGGSIAGVTIGGAIRGTGNGCGRIEAASTIGQVTVAREVVGVGIEAGFISAGGKITGVTVGGFLQGSGESAGRIVAGGDIASIKIAGDVQGLDGTGAGSIESSGKLTSVTIGGSLIGGGGDRTGRIFSKAGIGSATIGRSVVGGNNIDSGEIASDGPVASVRLGGSLRGGGGVKSGRLFANAALGSITIAGDIVGGSGADSGAIAAQTTANKIQVVGDVIGGSGLSAGGVAVQDVLTSLSIGGSLIGGAGNSSGLVGAAGIGSIAITGDVVGGSIGGSENLAGSGLVLSTGRVSKLTIGGSLIAGTDATSGQFLLNGAVIVGEDLVDATIGNIAGNATNSAFIFARGQENPSKAGDLAIGRLNVLGGVEFAQIRAGVDPDLDNADNFDAQIGTVTVGGDWVASSIAAGATPGGSGFFGDGDDEKSGAFGSQNNPNVVSKINSLSIGGQALGSLGNGDFYGIVAEQIGAVKIGGTPLVLHAGPDDDNAFIGGIFDFKVHEL